MESQLRYMISIYTEGALAAILLQINPWNGLNCRWEFVNNCLEGKTYEATWYCKSEVKKFEKKNILRS